MRHRRLLFLALLLLSLSLSLTPPPSSASCAGEEPCEDVIVPPGPPLIGAPRLLGVQVVRSGAGLAAVWAPPAGQFLVCGIRVVPRPSQPLEPCHLGGGGSHTFATPQDASLQVAPGNMVELRAYDSGGTLLAAARVVVSDRWRTALPLLAR